MLSGLLTFLLIVCALVLIVLIIALQHGNEGGIGSAFGSGNSTGFFGASGGVSLIIRATWIFGAAFFVIGMSLAWLKTREHYGVGREIDGLLKGESPGASAPVSTSPAAGAPAAPVESGPGTAGTQLPSAPAPAEGVGGQAPALVPPAAAPAAP